MHIVEVLAKFGQPFAHIMLKDFLVHEHPNHITVVIKGQVALHNLAHRPECLFLAHTTKKTGSYEIHTLTVTNGRISDHDGIEHVT